MLGVQEYDAQGKPVCAICGKSFHRLIAHVRQKHFISGAEYRRQNGFCITFAFISKTSKEKISEKTLQNADVVIKKNLIEGGKESRFKKGNPGIKVVMSAQRYLIIRNNRSKQKFPPKKKCYCACGKIIARKTKQCQSCFLKKHNDNQRKKNGSVTHGKNINAGSNSENQSGSQENLFGSIH